MTRIARLASLTACLAIALPTAGLFAQVKEMGAAQQYYKANPKFHFSKAATTKDGTAKWSAKTQEYVKDEYVILEGEVKLHYQDINLTADKITYNLRTKDSDAEGHVILDQGATRLSGSRAVYNLDSKTGTFFNATASFEPSIHLTADKLEKVDEDSYQITNGLFTSCDLDRPAWSFRMASGLVTLDDYARLHHLQLRARNIPVFWTPYLVWPTKRDRAQGFLIPRVSSMGNQEFGPRFEMGYFIPIGDSADTTLYADLNPKGYFGAGVDFRYTPSTNIKLGEFSAYAVRNKATGGAEWKYWYKHAQDNLPAGFRGVVDVQDYSDLDFFRRYETSDPNIHTLSTIYSSAYLTKNRSNYSLNILTDRRDIFLTTTQKQRFEQEPSLQFRIYPDQIGSTPFYFSLESSASHLRTSAINSCASNDLACHPTETAIDYSRGDFYPRVSMQIHSPAWLSIKPELSVRQTWYSASLDPNGGNLSSSFPPATVDQPLSRFYGQGEVDVIGPSISRVFNEEFGGFSKFKHVIEPRLRYLYTTPMSDQDQKRIIRFDTVDSPLLPIVRDSVEYELVQRIIGKGIGANASSREILSLTLRQSVSLGKPFTNTTNGSSIPTGQTQRFTPLIGSLHINPYQSITLDASTTFGNFSHQVEQTSLSANLVGKDRYLGLTWFASYLAPGATAGDSSQIRLNAGSPLLSDRMRADIQINYDAKTGAFLDQHFVIGYNGSCYGLAPEYRRYQIFTSRGLEYKHSFAFAVSLKNVGTVGGKL
jgi:LPS-assembly protein